MVALCNHHTYGETAVKEERKGRGLGALSTQRSRHAATSGHLSCCATSLGNGVSALEPGWRPPLTATAHSFPGNTQDHAKGEGPPAGADGGFHRWQGGKTCKNMVAGRPPRAGRENFVAGLKISTGGTGGSKGWWVSGNKSLILVNRDPAADPGPFRLSMPLQVVSAFALSLG